MWLDAKIDAQMDGCQIKYESAITSLLEDDPTANQAEFCVHIRS